MNWKKKKTGRLLGGVVDPCSCSLQSLPGKDKVINLHMFMEILYESGGVKLVLVWRFHAIKVKAIKVSDIWVWEQDRQEVMGREE